MFSFWAGRNPVARRLGFGQQLPHPPLPPILDPGGYFVHHRRNKHDKSEENAKRFKRQGTTNRLKGFINPNDPKLEKTGSTIIEMSNPMGGTSTVKEADRAVL
jgi:hypothetical protein